MPRLCLSRSPVGRMRRHLPCIVHQIAGDNQLLKAQSTTRCVMRSEFDDRQEEHEQQSNADTFSPFRSRRSVRELRRQAWILTICDPAMLNTCLKLLVYPSVVPYQRQPGVSSSYGVYCSNCTVCYIMHPVSVEVLSLDVRPPFSLQLTIRV